MKMQKALIGMMVMLLSVSARADNPAISNVTVTQRWPWSRLVDIDYVLDCDPGQTLDINVEAYDGSSRLALPSGSLSGDLFNVPCGARRITWDPTATDYANDGVLCKFRVALTATPVPLYMIVDLTKSAGEAGQTEYVYEEDLTNGLWGAWVRNPVTNKTTVIESVIWTGVTTNDVYKTAKLVLRRIPKGEPFEMGIAKISTTLTKDFYVGVFEVTQRQWELIMGYNPSNFKNASDYATRPLENASYDIMRGATNSVPAIDWPWTGSLVLPSSFVGTLRAKTAFIDFDLPTEAQWEYACRSGTTTRYNDGLADSSDDDLSKLGWWNGNSAVNDVVTTHSVGKKTPNAWGLYDMHGNVGEFCLNWSGPLEALEGGEDPKGPESGKERVFRGGYYRGYNYYCQSHWSNTKREPWSASPFYGFRLVRTLP